MEVEDSMTISQHDNSVVLVLDLDSDVEENV